MFHPDFETFGVVHYVLSHFELGGRSKSLYRSNTLQAVNIRFVGRYFCIDSHFAEFA